MKNKNKGVKKKVKEERQKRLKERMKETLPAARILTWRQRCSENVTTNCRAPFCLEKPCFPPLSSEALGGLRSGIMASCC